MWHNQKLARYPNLIRAYRLQRGWSQKQLAAKTGVKHTAVSTWERGYVLTWLPKILELAAALDTLVENLYWPLYRPKSPAAHRIRAEYPHRHGGDHRLPAIES